MENKEPVKSFLNEMLSFHWHGLMNYEINKKEHVLCVHSSSSTSASSSVFSFSYFCLEN